MRHLLPVVLLVAACAAPGPDDRGDAGTATPPDTVLLEHPEERTEVREATFVFASRPPGLPLECDHEQQGFAPCASPLTLTGLSPGLHAFAVRAVDAAGRADPSPAVILWEVVERQAPPPDSRITSGPASPSEATSATFTFESIPEGQAFDCRLGEAWRACTSPWTVSGLGEGAHTFAVRAVDPDGAADPTPATWSWEVALPPAGTAPMRLVAANLTSGNYQAYEDPGIRILQGLDADVVLIQEFNYGDNGPEDLRAFVDQAFGVEFAFYREPDGQIPNGIVSRWPILESGRWEDAESPNREWAWARIDVPGPVDLWAVSLHLLTRNASTRALQAEGLLPHLKALPAGDYLVVGGDLNTAHTAEAALAILDEVVDADGPWPADQEDVTGTNASREKPYDHLLVDDDLGTWSVPVRVGEAAFTHGLVFDSRVYAPLADVPPVRVGDSGVAGMQHMAVIKDFELPE